MQNVSIIQLLKFKGKWRVYQQKILDNLEQYLNDKKLNIVAAPGAGKTTLGIEVIRRFGNNALILSPTIPIKNQWKTRIVEDFLQDNKESEELISTDIKEIKDITTTTYQRLQAVFRKGLEEELIKELEEHNIKTLVLDEAHHLRDEWYRTLKDLIEKISKDKNDFKIISLTATPPYDVSEKEWNNYYELCGEIDEEISVPELVRTKDLCPHQDLLYFSNLDEEERKTVYTFSSKREEFFDYINKNPDFIMHVENSPLLKNIYQNGDNFYLDMDFTIGMISYLLNINPNHNIANNIIDYLQIYKANIPKFDFETAENFINGLIGRFKEYFKNSNIVKNKLKELNLLKNYSKVDFFGNENYKKMFARSKNKIASIKRITATEYDILGDDLREVILLDYIGEKSKTGGMNIVSTFKALDFLARYFVVKNKRLNLKIGILSGSLSVIPKTAKEKFNEILKNNNIATGKVLFTDYDENYYRLEAYGNTDLVKLVTELFETGEINVLLGTHALLGEGWDSPCINTLILGSVVESFMLSNQMRGRALRVDKNNHEKTADIWHLLAIENDITTSYDYQKISRRFETFDGINYKHNIIENGLERLGNEFVNIDTKNIASLNNISTKRARERKTLFIKWDKCLNTSANKTKLIKQKRMYEGIKITKTEETYVFCKKFFTIQKLHPLFILNKIIFIIGSIFLVLYYIHILLSYSPILKTIVSWIILVVVSLNSTNEFSEKAHNLVAEFSFDRILNCFGIKRTDLVIAEALFDTLCQNKYIDDPLNAVKVTIKGKWIHLTHANYYLEQAFLAQLLQIFQTPEKIRFIVKLKEHKDKIIFLPTEVKTFGDAMFFTNKIKKYFGETEIIDSSLNIDKKEILKSRYKNFITAKVKKHRIFQ